MTAATDSIELEARRNTDSTVVGLPPSHHRCDSVGLLGSLGVPRERLRSLKSTAAVRRRLTALALAASSAGCGGPPEPLPPAGALVHALYDCAACHESGPGPALEGFGTAPRTRAFLVDPDAPRLFGRTRHAGVMPATKMDPRRLDRLTDWLLTGAPDDHPGARDFVKAGCGDCHTDPRPATAATERHVGQTGPRLEGYGSAAWVEAFLVDPTSELYFGPAAAGETHCPPRPSMPHPWREALSTWIVSGGLGPWAD